MFLMIMKNDNEFIDFLWVYDVVSFMIMIVVNINGYKFWNKKKKNNE